MEIRVIYSAVGPDRAQRWFITSRDLTNEKRLSIYISLLPHDSYKIPMGSPSLFSFDKKWSRFREVKPSTPGNTWEKEKHALNPCLLNPSPILFPEPNTMPFKKVHFQLTIAYEVPSKVYILLDWASFIITDLRQSMYWAHNKYLVVSFLWWVPLILQYLIHSLPQYYAVIKDPSLLLVSESHWFLRCQRHHTWLRVHYFSFPPDSVTSGKVWVWFVLRVTQVLHIII